MGELIAQRRSRAEIEQTVDLPLDVLVENGLEVGAVEGE